MRGAVNAKALTEGWRHFRYIELSKKAKLNGAGFYIEMFIWRFQLRYRYA
jgi:hypothetical protein